MKRTGRYPAFGTMVIATLFLLGLQGITTQLVAQQKTTSAPVQQVLSAKKINPTTVELALSGNKRMTLDFYGENIFRVFLDDSDGYVRAPEAKPPAQILVNNPRKEVKALTLSDNSSSVNISTGKVDIQIGKRTGFLKVINGQTKKVVLETVTPVVFDKENVTLTLKEGAEEYFYGGGVQNGRFSHKGKVIAIENQNSWTDGGVASPTPYYWSTNGYGMMWHTFKKGRYDFGAKEKGRVSLSHESPYLDLFLMISDGAVALLNDFYQLTGNPVLLPKFAFYQGHLNAYNRDFWKEDSTGILFEDGKRYRESQKDNGGIKESLNGEKNNYPFSARAVIDRYKKHDMPLGWILPNDGYGAGYGQTGTLDSNILNLKNLGDYARKNGVEIGLWTQSDLHPKPEVGALLQRDIIKETRDAGVRVLKTDVAWVGAGYSFGLNGVADVANIMSYYGNARPFIISLDGWAGTQRYAGIWSGDQTGGVWEYIRFHIPTYLGSGLSGQPNITSDMDGIFGGKNPVVNMRDFQWKTFTPMQLNMDGWGSNEKYPHALGEPAASVNRHYLKLKAELMPYAYSIAQEAVKGMPMIRAMFLEYPNAYTMGTATQYQFMYGPDFLVAPIYKETRADKEGNDIRNGIYLPKGTWIDYFTGAQYEGNRILNTFDAPFWKLPVFVRKGAIIPITDPHNNVSEINKSTRKYELYPSGKNAFLEYDDDGTTEAWRAGKSTTTLIEAELDGRNRVAVTVHPTKGGFEGFVPQQTTAFVVNLTQQPEKVAARIGKKKTTLAAVHSMEEFQRKENVYFYHAAPELNRFATPGSAFAGTRIIKNPQLLVKLAATDITLNTVELHIEGFRFEPADKLLVTTGKTSAPELAQVREEQRGAYTLTPAWSVVPNADYYEIDFEGMRYSTIRDTSLLFEGLAPETDYKFKLRSVNKDGHSEWKTFNASTRKNPLEYAIKSITARSTAPDQGGSGIGKLFDFDEGNMWHTKWGTNSVPFEFVMDLKAIYTLDKFHYLPRTGRGNGMLLRGTVAYSADNLNWTEAGNFQWKANDSVKIFGFPNQPSARYIRIAVTEGVGGFGSGRELYVFKVPGTESYLPGDINNDRVIDRNDLTAYLNYTGLRKGDGDFDGYISNGDVNRNDLIDAYDISVVATQLEPGENGYDQPKLNGRIVLSTPKKEYQQGETIQVKVTGTDLKAVNAFGFSLPYDPQELEYTGIQALQVNGMENFTYDRLHTNGARSLYPTFIHLGNKAPLAGSSDLFIITFKAKRKTKPAFKPGDGLLINKKLETLRF
ncbi:MAG: TIM-barrel domain-containing protein [Chitinophagaceae bacterium]